MTAAIIDLELFFYLAIPSRERWRLVFRLKVGPINLLDFQIIQVDVLQYSGLKA